jgi:hypothetical protein
MTYIWYAPARTQISSKCNNAAAVVTSAGVSFGLLAREAGGQGEAMRVTKNGQFGIWLPIVHAFRTFVACPPPVIRAVLQQIQTLTAP